MTDPYDTTPDDLPEVKEKASGNPIDLGRTCPTCKGEARVVSNRNGVRAYCGPCKQDWAISGPRDKVMPHTLPRGISKQTLVQPDWEMAYEFTDDDDEFKKND
jgi:hypothetical protein